MKRASLSLRAGYDGVISGLHSRHISGRDRLRIEGAVNRLEISCAGYKQVVYEVSIRQIPICDAVAKDSYFDLALVAAIFTGWHFFRAHSCAVCFESDSF
jgi:hypothetical protein